MCHGAAAVEGACHTGATYQPGTCRTRSASTVELHRANNETQNGRVRSLTRPLPYLLQKKLRSLERDVVVSRRNRSRGPRLAHSLLLCDRSGRSANIAAFLGAFVHPLL